MSRTAVSRAVLSGLAVVALTAGSGFAAEPASTLTGDMVADLNGVAGKLVSLAEAIPAEKYTWRPAEGVRSVSEVFMHVAATNYWLPKAFGAAPGEGVGKEPEKVTDKAKVVAALKASFAYAASAVGAIGDSSWDKQIEMFKHTMSVRQAVLILVDHGHEHLGQAIAYARMNGVVPPWSRPGS